MRRAFALAVDKKALSNQVLAGQVVAADRILPAGLLGTQLPIRGLALDPAAAKAFYAKLFGWKMKDIVREVVDEPGRLVWRGVLRKRSTASR